MNQVAQERVANGSRRKRDLAATSPQAQADAYRAKHFPNETRYAVSAAWHFVRRANGGSYPDPAAVRARMEDRGWLNSQRGGSNA